MHLSNLFININSFELSLNFLYIQLDLNSVLSNLTLLYLFIFYLKWHMTFIYFLAFVYYGYVCIVCVYVLVHMCVHVYVCWEWDKQSSPRKSIPISWSSKWSALKNIHTYTEQDIFSNVFSNVCNCCI